MSLNIAETPVRGELDKKSTLNIQSVPAKTTRTLMRSQLEDPNAAPLEQNEKNLECNGINYKVVKELFEYGKT